MPFEFSMLSQARLNAFARDKTIFFFPVGPLEDCGPHLPMGLPLELASQYAFSCAAELEKRRPDWTFVVMPPAPLGIDAHTCLALTVRGHVLRDWLVDACRSLGKQGFFYFVCFSGNLGPRQLTAIEEASRWVRTRAWWFPSFLLRKQRLTLISASSAWVDAKTVFRSPFWLDAQEHGGQEDTSLALALVLDLVDEAFKNLPSMALEGSFLRRFFDRKRVRPGYWGDPASASAEEGRRLLEQRLEPILSRLTILIENGSARTFRSWYSLLPWNQTFFQAWVMIFGIFVFLMGSYFLMHA